MKVVLQWRGAGARGGHAHFRSVLPLRRMRQRAQDEGQLEAAHDAHAQASPPSIRPTTRTVKTHAPKVEKRLRVVKIIYYYRYFMEARTLHSNGCAMCKEFVHYYFFANSDLLKSCSLLKVAGIGYFYCMYNNTHCIS
jgi:hypothetical protein